MKARTGAEQPVDKAAQRVRLANLQENATSEELHAFEELGTWLALFVKELQAYVEFPIMRVTAGGKVADAETGHRMLVQAEKLLNRPVVRAQDSLFGQAIAVAQAVRPKRS